MVELQVYDPLEVVVFRRTREQFGGLSNMAHGYPLVVGRSTALTVEALYQSLRFPRRPDIQRAIIETTNPVIAKATGRRFIDETRSDWLRVRISVMRWCLRQKLLQHPRAFRSLLLSTGDLPIVEYSAKDIFWGASPTADTKLSGMNVLGRLLVELRVSAARLSGDIQAIGLAPDFPDAILLGEPLQRPSAIRDSAIRELREIFVVEQPFTLERDADVYSVTDSRLLTV